MSSDVVYENEHITMYYHPDTKIVHHVYESTIGGETLKHGLTLGVDLLKQHNAEKWLSDNRKSDAHTEEETEWINSVWLPSAIEAGWKFWALVVPDSFIARVNQIEFVQAFYDMGVWVRVFINPDEAMAWLIEAEQPIKS